MKKPKSPLVSSIALLVAFMLGIGYLQWELAPFLFFYKTTKARVVDIDLTPTSRIGEHTATLVFELPDKRRVESALDYTHVADTDYLERRYLKQEIEVRVSPFKANAALSAERVFSAHFRLWFMMIFQLAMVYAVFLLSRRQYFKLFKERAIKNQIQIWGKLKRIKEDHSLKVDGHYPYVLVLEGNFNGEVQEFISGYIWKKPDASVIPKNILIYVNEFDSKQYYVDLSFLSGIS